MAYLFKDCSYLNKVVFNNETPRLSNIKYMFYNCDSLTIANLNLDTSKVTQMDYMFYNCVKLNYLDISSFYLENLINSSYMFQGCTNLTEIKFNDNSTTKN